MSKERLEEDSERIKNNALEQIDVTQRRNERLEQQNKRYREVLEYYAENSPMGGYAQDVLEGEK